MTKSTETEKQPRKRLLIKGVVGVLAIIGAVYVISGPNGNSGSAQTCARSMEIAQSLKPLAKGEVAAFLPAQTPLPLSEITFNDPNGKPLKLSAFNERTVLLNLWATWCAPCRKEMPALDALQSQLGSDDFEVVTVNLDRGGIDKPKAFLEEIGVETLKLYNDPSNKMLTELRKKGRGTGLPTTILVGPDGCETGTMYGPAEWNSDEAVTLINEALSKPQG